MFITLLLALFFLSLLPIMAAHLGSLSVGSPLTPLCWFSLFWAAGEEGERRRTF